VQIDANKFLDFSDDIFVNRLSLCLTNAVTRIVITFAVGPILR